MWLSPTYVSYRSLISAVVWVALSGVCAAQGIPKLFDSAPPAAARANSAVAGGPPTVSQRWVRLNTKALGLQDGGVLLNLFPDAEYRFERVGPARRLRSGRWIWEAKRPDADRSYAILIFGEHGVRGNISDGAGRYFKVLPGSGDVYEVREVSVGFVDRREDVDIPPQQALESAARAWAKAVEEPTQASQSTPVYLDILVAYSAAARQEVGGAAAIAALADATLAEVNVGLASSEIDARFRLAAAVEVAVPAGEAASSVFLSAVTGLSTLESLRNQYGADLVTVWIDGPASGGGIVGRAWIMQSVGSWFASSAYSVVEVNWVDGPSLSFAHEAGHNLGAAHDRDNAGVSGAYSYSYGYQQDALSPRFYTVMGYSNGCGGCSGVNYWSNPNVSYGGNPTGVASGSNSANNASTLNQTRLVATDWREEVVTANESTTTGVFRPTNGAIFLKSANQTGFADAALTYGLPGDKPLAGDWNNDNIDSIGVFRSGEFHLRNSKSNGFADYVFAYGAGGDLPVAGDWDGDGVDTVGVFRNGLFLLRDANSSGAPDYIFSLGVAGDVPIAGDWDGDGVDTVGVFRPSNGALYLKNVNSTGFADIVLTYGLPGDKPVTGDWDGDGDDTIGVCRDGLFLLRNSNTNGFADIVFSLGVAGDEPIAGRWGDL